jgi:hypothetical protein
MPAQPSVGELLGALARDTGVLVRQEVRLASTELAAKTSNATKAVGVVAAGGALAHAGFLALMSALVLGLSTLIPLWVSALIVGLVIAGAGYGVIRMGVHALRVISPVPQQAVMTLKDDAVWAKEQVR